MDRTRASDSERERVVGMLREAAIAGRLTVEELDARCESAYSAVTRGELAALLEDLPVGSRIKPPPSTVEPVPAVPSEPGWPGASPWLAGDQRFYVQWKGPSNPQQAGAQIMEHLIVERSPDTLRRSRSP